MLHINDLNSLHSQYFNACHNMSCHCLWVYGEYVIECIQFEVVCPRNMPLVFESVQLCNYYIYFEIININYVSIKAVVLLNNHPSCYQGGWSNTKPVLNPSCVSECVYVFASIYSICAQKHTIGELQLSVAFIAPGDNTLVIGRI